MSWELKALAYSGDPTYLPLLERVIESHPSSSIKKRAIRARDLLKHYQQWNPIIRAGIEEASTQDELVVRRLRNMLHAEAWELNRAAAKQIYFKYHRDKGLTEIVAQHLQQRLKEGSAKRGLHYDAIAWFCKVLGRSKDQQYAPLIQEVIDQSISPMSVAAAEQALAVLSDS